MPHFLVKLLLKFYNLDFFLTPFKSELWNFLGPFALFEEHHKEISPRDIEIATEILNFYTGGGGPQTLSPDNFWNVTEMFTDSFFWVGNYLFLRDHLRHSTGKTYQYRFSYNVSEKKF